MAFCVFFAITVFYNQDINQIDIKIIFFYDLIDQLAYVKIPKVSEIESNWNIICKLFKILYDLK